MLQRFDITPFTYHLCCPDCGGDWTICGHATPDAVLELAELTADAKTLAEERAANGDWPAPVTVADYLAWIEDEATIQEEAVQAARQSVTLTLNQYKAGTVSFLNVVVVQTAQLNNERTLVGILGRRLTAAVALVKALGGGWNAMPADTPAGRAPAR